MQESIARQQSLVFWCDCHHMHIWSPKQTRDQRNVDWRFKNVPFQPNLLLYTQIHLPKHAIAIANQFHHSESAKAQHEHCLAGELILDLSLFCLTKFETTGFGVQVLVSTKYISKGSCPSGSMGSGRRTSR